MKLFLNSQNFSPYSDAFFGRMFPVLEDFNLESSRCEMWGVEHKRTVRSRTFSVRLVCPSHNHTFDDGAGIHKQLPPRFSISANIQSCCSLITEGTRCNGFLCSNNTCLPATAHCNGIQDCSDGADEHNCGECSLFALAHAPQDANNLAVLLNDESLSAIQAGSCCFKDFWVAQKCP